MALRTTVDSVITVVKKMGPQEFRDFQEALREESERRARPACPPRTELDLVDWTGVYNRATNLVERSFKEDCEVKDIEQYLCESVLKAIYGDAIFVEMGKIGGG